MGVLIPDWYFEKRLDEKIQSLMGWEFPALATGVCVEIWGGSQADSQAECTAEDIKFWTRSRHDTEKLVKALSSERVKVLIALGNGRYQIFGNEDQIKRITVFRRRGQLAAAARWESELKKQEALLEQSSKDATSNASSIPPSNTGDPTPPGHGDGSGANNPPSHASSMQQGQQQAQDEQGSSNALALHSLALQNKNKGSPEKKFSTNPQTTPRDDFHQRGARYAYAIWGIVSSTPPLTENQAEAKLLEDLKNDRVKGFVWWFVKNQFGGWKELLRLFREDKLTMTTCCAQWRDAMAQTMRDDAKAAKSSSRSS